MSPSSSEDAGDSENPERTFPDPLGLLERLRARHARIDTDETTAEAFDLISGYYDVHQVYGWSRLFADEDERPYGYFDDSGQEFDDDEDDEDYDVHMDEEQDEDEEDEGEDDDEDAEDGEEDEDDIGEDEDDDDDDEEDEDYEEDEDDDEIGEAETFRIMSEIYRGTAAANAAIPGGLSQYGGNIDDSSDSGIEDRPQEMEIPDRSDRSPDIDTWAVNRLIPQFNVRAGVIGWQRRVQKTGKTVLPSHEIRRVTRQSQSDALARILAAGTFGDPIEPPKQSKESTESSDPRKRRHMRFNCSLPALQLRKALTPTAGCYTADWHLPSGTGNLHTGFDPSPGRVCHTYDAPVYNVGFSRSGRLLFAGCQDSLVHVLERSSTDPRGYQPHALFQVPVHRWTLTATCMSPTEDLLAAASLTPHVALFPMREGPFDDPEPTIIDVTGRAERHGLRHANFRVYSLAFSPSGAELAAATAGKRHPSVYIVGVEQGKPIAELKSGHGTYDINAVVYADPLTPSLVVSGGDDATVRLWDLRTRGEPVGSFLGHTEGVSGLDVTDDGGFVLSNGKDGRALLWDRRRMYTGRGPRIARHATSTLRSGGGYLQALVLPREPREHPYSNALATYRGHQVSRTLIRAKFSPRETTGQRYICSGGGDGVATVWHVDGRVVARLGTSGRGEGAAECVRDVAWAPQGMRIVTACWTDYGGSLVSYECNAK